MLQVQPTGLQPSRPAAKAPHPEPAEAGFPAIALLAVGQPPAPPREPEAPAGPEAREASVSQPSPEQGRTRETEPARPGEEEPEATREEPAPVALEAALQAAQPDPVSAVAEMPLPETGNALPPATAVALPAPLAAAPLPQPLAAVPLPSPGVASIPPGGNPAPAEPPGPLTAATPVAHPEAAAAAAPETGPPAPAADFPAALATAAAPETPSPDPGTTAPATPQATVAALPTLAKPARGVPARSSGGTPTEPLPESEPSALRADKTTGAESSPAQRSLPRLALPAGAAPDLPAAGSPKSARPEVPIQAPPGLPATARFNVLAGPARPVEAEPPAKDAARAAEPRRPAEEAQPHPTEPAASTAQPAATRPAQASTESATALPRSESLGLQPSQQLSAAGSPAPVAARSEVAATWQVPVPPVLQQVENGIRWMLRNASPGAELQLHPEALGRVRIELRVEGGEVHARLWASDPKSIPVLQENKAFLEVSLKEQGLNLGSFDLRQNSNQAHPGFTDGQSRGQFWPTEAGAAEPRQDAPTRPAPRNANPRRIELIA